MFRKNPYKRDCMHNLNYIITFKNFEVFIV